MDKKYYLRKKNTLFMLKLSKKDRGKTVVRTWHRPKICSSGWAVVEDKSSIARLEEDLKNKLLTEIPGKIFDENAARWAEQSEEGGGES